MEHLCAQNKLATAYVILAVSVLTVHASGYLTTSTFDPDDPPSLLQHDHRLDVRVEGTTQKIALHIPQFAEEPTHRPKFSVRKPYKKRPRSTTTSTTTEWPPIQQSMFIEPNAERPSGPISTYAYLTYTNSPHPSHFNNHNQPSLNPIHVATIGPPTRLYAHNEYLANRYGRKPLKSFHTPLKSMVKKKETGMKMQPTILRGLATVRRTMMGMMSRIQTVWSKIFSFVGSKRNN